MMTISILTTCLPENFQTSMEKWYTGQVVSSDIDEAGARGKQIQCQIVITTSWEQSKQ